MKTTSAIVAAIGIVVSVALAVAVVLQNREITRLAREVDSLRKTSTVANAAMPSNSLSKKSIASGSDGNLSIAVAESALGRDPTSKSPARPSTASTGEQDTQRRFMRQMKELRDNPVMNELMAAQQRATLEVMYKGLVGKFHFSEEEKKQFFDLLLSRQMNNADLGMQLSSDNCRHRKPRS